MNSIPDAPKIILDDEEKLDKETINQMIKDRFKALMRVEKL